MMVLGGPGTDSEGFHADQAYNTKEIRIYLKRRGIKANIPVNSRNRRKPKWGGRPHRLRKEAYKSMRSAAERGSSHGSSPLRRITVR